MVVDCFIALNDEELSEDERVLTCLLIFYEEFQTVEEVLDYLQENGPGIIEEMYKFFRCGMVDIGHRTRHTLIDWEKDEQMICSAINNVANKEIRFEPFLHWWTFMGYYNSVGESVLSTVVTIRNKIAEHKKLEKFEKEFKQNNPEYFNIDLRSVQEKELTNQILEQWNNN